MIKGPDLLRRAKITYNCCVMAISEGKQQLDVLKQLQISKPTLKKHLSKFHTSWADLCNRVNELTFRKTTQIEQTAELDPVYLPEKFEPEHFIEERETAISDQYKDIVNHVRYAQSQGLQNTNIRDVIMLFDKTKQLEDEEKEFAEDQDFLRAVEDLARAWDLGPDQVFEGPATPPEEDAAQRQKTLLDPDQEE